MKTFHISILGVAAALSFSPAAFADHKAETVEQAQFEQAVAAFILDHPEVLFEAVERYELEQQANQLALAEETVEAEAEMIFASASDPFIGDPNGTPVVEFFDYNCPYCKRQTAISDELMAKDAGVKYIFKEFPILSQSSEYTAQVALAIWAIAPEKYFEFHEIAYQVAGDATIESLVEVGSSLGLDTATLQAEAESDWVMNKINETRALASRLGINGTPGFVIGQQVLPGLQQLPALEMSVALARQ